MARWHYRYAGLEIASDLELPEWQAFATGTPDPFPDVEIRLEAAATEPSALRLTPDEYRFQIDEAGEYWVQGGRSIRITPHPQAGPRELRLFLLGSAWGALCYQRGQLALHASVVEVDGQAVAFCGASGAGKSSVAAALVAQGHSLIGDDLCLFDLSREIPHVYPAAPRLKLWREALDRLGWAQEGLEQDHFRMDKYHVRSDDGRAFAYAGTPGDPVPMRAIYLLGWDEPGITRLTGLVAITQLVESATYRGDLLEPMGALAAHWQRCVTLAQRVPIFRWTRPRDWSALPRALEVLTAAWQIEQPALDKSNA